MTSRAGPKQQGAAERYHNEMGASAKKEKEHADELAHFMRLAEENARAQNQLAHRAAAMMGMKNKPVNQSNAIKSCLYRHVHPAVKPYPIEHEMLFKRVSAELNKKKHFNPNYADVQAALDSLLNLNQLDYHISDSTRLYARPMFQWDLFDTYYKGIAEEERDEIIREEISRIPKQQEMLRLQEKQRLQKEIAAKKKIEDRKKAKLAADAKAKEDADEVARQKKVELEALANAQKITREQERFEAEKQARLLMTAKE